MSRVETGVVQFGDDWPGVFIRGDDAAWFALHITDLLDGRFLVDSDDFADQMRCKALANLRDLLTASDARNKPETQQLPATPPDSEPTTSQTHGEQE